MFSKIIYFGFFNFTQIRSCRSSFETLPLDFGTRETRYNQGFCCKAQIGTREGLYRKKIDGGKWSNATMDTKRKRERESEVWHKTLISLGARSYFSLMRMRRRRGVHDNKAPIWHTCALLSFQSAILLFY